MSLNSGPRLSTLDSRPSTQLSLIVAVARNGVIGRQGGLPWRLSADLRRFKELTMGHAIIMGRKTYESIGRPLPGRRMIVITRQADYRTEGAEVVGALDEALRRAADRGDGECFVIGGAEIYEQAKPQADRVYLTRVRAAVEGDTYFSPLNLTQWRLVSSESHAADAKNQYPFSFEVYERVHP
jgi:dihydrofolate reductase